MFRNRSFDERWSTQWNWAFPSEINSSRHSDQTRVLRVSIASTPKKNRPDIDVDSQLGDLRSLSRRIVHWEDSCSVVGQWEHSVVELHWLRSCSQDDWRAKRIHLERGKTFSTEAVNFKANLRRNEKWRQEWLDRDSGEWSGRASSLLDSDSEDENRWFVVSFCLEEGYECHQTRSTTNGSELWEEESDRKISSRMREANLFLFILSPWKSTRSMMVESNCSVEW